MRRTGAVSPFLPASGDSVVPEPWRLVGGSDFEGRVEHWDPDLVLRLERRVAIDVDRVIAATGIGGGELVAAVLWRSSRTRLKGPGMSVPLSQEGGAVVTLGVDVPGQRAGGRLELQTLLMRSDESASSSPITARRPGSILWDDWTVVALEGGAARFPVTVVDFADLVGFAPDAAWALEWTPHDLDQPVLGAMRLLINARSAAAVDAVGAASRPEAPAVASTIRFDVTRSLVHGALGSDEFLENPDGFEPDTVGRMLSDLLGRFWPGAEPSALAARLLETPHRLETELQARSELLAP